MASWIQRYLDEIIFILSLCLILLFGFGMRHKICFQHPIVNQLKEKMTLLSPRAQQLTWNASNESYTEDKSKIYVCVLDPHTGQLYSPNFLTYVAIHELAHALSPNIDTHHTSPEFRQIFSDLLDKAVRLGIYDPTEPKLKQYCGLKM
jgi:hypothetical protein